MVIELRQFIFFLVIMVSSAPSFCQNNSLSCRLVIDSLSGREVYQDTKILSHYPGGRIALQKFTDTYLKYPKHFRGEGVVFIQAISNRDSTLSDLRVLRSIHPIVDREAIELVKKIDLWLPGYCDNQPVDSYVDIPISFDAQSFSEESNTNSSNCVIFQDIIDVKSKASLQGSVNSEFQSYLLSSICVELKSDSVVFARTAVDDQNKYYFNDLPPETYDIVFIYEGQEKTISEVQVKPNKITFIDLSAESFFMTRRKYKKWRKRKNRRSKK